MRFSQLYTNHPRGVAAAAISSTGVYVLVALVSPSIATVLGVGYLVFLATVGVLIDLDLSKQRRHRGPS